jgi:hypothetical protein
MNADDALRDMKRILSTWEQPDSPRPTRVQIAWLVSEVDRLRRVIAANAGRDR